MTEAEEAVRREIVAAFVGGRPPDEAIGGGGCPCPEHDALEADFRGRAWTEVSIATVCAHRSDLPLFSPAARRHYLPGYLLACLEAPVEADVAVDSVLAELSPPRSAHGKNRDAFEARVAELDAAQRRAIGGFVAAIAARHPGDPRVERANAYWSVAAADAG